MDCVLRARALLCVPWFTDSWVFCSFDRYVLRDGCCVHSVLREFYAACASYCLKRHWMLRVSRAACCVTVCCVHCVLLAASLGFVCTVYFEQGHCVHCVLLAASLGCVCCILPAASLWAACTAYCVPRHCVLRTAFLVTVCCVRCGDETSPQCLGPARLGLRRARSILPSPTPLGWWKENNWKWDHHARVTRTGHHRVYRPPPPTAGGGTRDISTTTLISIHYWNLTHSVIFERRIHNIAPSLPERRMKWMVIEMPWEVVYF